ncbi:MAG TPA: hypothetical protein VEK15_04835, partial [Vicinamibacteria bacterium]|nr:hypothetical protein [Vicinamibacteria bacterium]
RLFEGRDEPAYAVRSLLVPGLRDVSFRHVLEHFEDDLFDARMANGWLVFFDPARMKARSGLSYVAFGSTQEEALHRADVVVPRALPRLVRFRRSWMRVGLP